MARTPTIWFRRQTGWYYTTFNGEQVRLSKDKKEAKRAFHTLLASNEPARDGKVLRSFRKVADLYLQHCKKTKNGLTHQLQQHFLQSFCDQVGKRKVVDIRPAHVTDWLLGQEGWGHNTRVTGRGILRACLNWALAEGIIDRDPMPSFKVGTMHRRERILTADEKARIRAAVNDESFADFLLLLEHTGARPYSEAGTITADMIDWQRGRVPLEKHKNARKGKSRVLYLTPAVTKMLRRRTSNRPQGLLFTTRNGVPYNRCNTTQRIRRIEKKAGVKRFNLYAYRHSYITDALAKGLSSDIVAELVGNTARTISKYYAHLDQKQEALREAALRAVG